MGDKLDIVVWKEHWNPNDTLRRPHLFHYFDRPPQVMADEEIRDFISRGMGFAGFKNGRIEQGRRAREADQESRRGRLEHTLATVRVMSQCLCPGLT